VAAVEQRLGEGVVVRSDDVEGNEVSGTTWRADGGGEEHHFVALFTDDGEVVDCSLEGAGSPGEP
jgi:hypothetical protein